MDFEITLNDLRGEQKELASVIGIKAYITLVNTYGGTSIYIAKADKIRNIKRDTEIAKKFNGYNYVSLAKEYGLSDRTVRDIIAEQFNGINGQITF